MDLVKNLLQQIVNRSNQNHHNNNTLYKETYEKIKKMTKTEILKRENHIYCHNLSSFSADREAIYMELGIILSVLENWPEN